MSKKFRIPRKTKKKLEKGVWLYPADNKGSSVAAFPKKDENDFKAYKSGILKNLFKSKPYKKRKAYWVNLNKEIYVSDEELKLYINDIFHSKYYKESLYYLLEAKKSKTARLAYFNFINSYKAYSNEDESSGNACCMAVDYAKKLLREEKNKGKVFNNRPKKF